MIESAREETEILLSRIFRESEISIRLFVRLFTQIAAFQTLHLIRYYFSYRDEVSSRYFFLPSF